MRRPWPLARLQGKLAVVRAVPAGSHRIRGSSVEKRYLEALDQWPDVAGLRADCRANVLLVAKVLARHASYEDGTSWPTRERVCAQAGLSLSTWKASRRRLEAWGFLGTVSPGRTGGLTGPAVLASPQARNDAAVYVLCVPGKGAFRRRLASSSLLTRPPTGSSPRKGTSPRARAAEDQTRDGPPSGRTPPLPAVAESLRSRRTGEKLTDGWWAHLARPFLAAGWTPADLAYAIDHGPDHQPRTWTYEIPGIRHPAGWLRSRLGPWLRPGPAWRHRVPLEPVSATRARGLERLRAAQARHRDQTAAAAAAAAPPTPAFRAALEEIRYRRRTHDPRPEPRHPDSAGAGIPALRPGSIARARAGDVRLGPA